jgi:hypothetical protein
VLKGYVRADFIDAWSRYLPSETLANMWQSDVLREKLPQPKVGPAGCLLRLTGPLCSP